MTKLSFALPACGVTGSLPVAHGPTSERAAEGRRGGRAARQRSHSLGSALQDKGGNVRGGRLFDLEAAVGAGALDERGGRAAGRAGQVLGLFVDRDRDRGEALAGEIGAPVVVEEIGQ